MQAAAAEGAAGPPVAVPPAAVEGVPEQPVFVARDGRRAMILRLAVRSVAAVTAAWLIALVTGAFGLGRLPAVPLPPIGALDETAGPEPGHAGTRTERAATIARGAATARSQVVGPSTGFRQRHTAPRPLRARERSDARRRSPASANPGSGLAPEGGRSTGSASPETTSSPATMTPTSKNHALSYTPSGNAVPAGTTDPGSYRPPQPVARGRGR